MLKITNVLGNDTFSRTCQCQFQDMIVGFIRQVGSPSEIDGLPKANGQKVIQ
jgi:hypothetical protein